MSSAINMTDSNRARRGAGLPQHPAVGRDQERDERDGDDEVDTEQGGSATH